MPSKDDTHSKSIGLLLWIFGFPAAHRFYYGNKISGLIWFYTGGLCLVGWIVDFFLIPGMEAEADRKYTAGKYDYNVAWFLLSTFLVSGLFGFHRFYMGKWITGIIWLCTGGLFTLGLAYDYWTLNEQLDELNRKSN